MTTRYDRHDRPVSRPGRRLDALFIAAALAAMIACGGGETKKTEGGKTSTKVAAAAPTPTPDAFPTNLAVGKSTIGDILITSVAQEFGTPQLNRSIDGTPLTIAGKRYETGVGTHAVGRLTVTFPAGSRTFSGACGVDEYVENRGSVIFRILAGDKVLYRSGVLKGKMPAASFSVPVSGLTELTLVADDAGDGNASDHADWVDLKVSK